MGKIYDALQKNNRGSQPSSRLKQARRREKPSDGAPAPSRPRKDKKLHVLKNELPPEHRPESSSVPSDTPQPVSSPRIPEAERLAHQQNVGGIENRQASDARKAEYSAKALPEKAKIIGKRGTSVQDLKVINKPIDPRLIVFHRPDSFEAEQIKILRTNILFPESGIPPRTIMVTSAAPGDGKSFIAASLSISIAQSLEEHVLLLDCDFRNSSIHDLFGYSVSQGLSDYLAKDIQLSSVIWKTALEKLSIIPGGTISKNPSELLSSKKMSDLIAEVRTRYTDRYVILDTPPPQITAEASAIARLVDGIIIICSAGQTKRDKVAHLVDILGRKKILGVVMNRYDTSGSRYDGYGRTQYHAK